MKPVNLDNSLFDSTDKADLQRKLKDIYRLIPTALLRPNSLKSWAYLIFDLAIISLLFGLGRYAWDQGNIALGLFYLLAQGSFFWSLFAIGHDCGHGSFSKRNWENMMGGYISHSFLLVPFYSWKLSHHKHHAFHGCVENDESHVPMPKKQFLAFLKQHQHYTLSQKLRLQLYKLLHSAGLSFIMYLFISNIFQQDKSMNHFNVNSPLMREHRFGVTASILGVLVMIGILAYVAVKTSLLFVAYLYVVPWLIYNFLFLFVTYLQHSSDDNFWFYEKDWHFLKGALQTMDYDYGRVCGPLFTFLHHGIARYHVTHHLNYKVPHYNLKKAHQAIEHSLGETYRLKTKPWNHYIENKHRKTLGVIDDYNPSIGKYRMVDLSRRKTKST
jgi:omega-3 fatty acid desaturase (delta-15 desaturase)